MSLQFDGVSFGKAIKKKRVFDLNVNLRDLAEELAVGHATLHRCEQGRMPDLKTFAIICEWLGEPQLSFHKKV